MCYCKWNKGEDIFIQRNPHEQRSEGGTQQHQGLSEESVWGRSRSGYRQEGMRLGMALWFKLSTVNYSTKFMDNLCRVLSKGMVSDLYFRKITLEAVDLCMFLVLKWSYGGLGTKYRNRDVLGDHESNLDEK